MKSPSHQDLVQAYLGYRRDLLQAWAGQPPRRAQADVAAALSAIDHEALDRCLAAPPADVDVHLCLLEQALGCAITAHDSDQTGRLLERIRHAVTPATSPELRALVHRCALRVAIARNDTSGALTEARAGLAVAPAGTPLHLGLACRVVVASINACDVHGLDNAMAIIEGQADRLSIFDVDIAHLRRLYDLSNGRLEELCDRAGVDETTRFVALCGTGRIADAERLLARMRDDARGKPEEQAMTECLRVKLALVRGRRPEAHRLLRRIGARTKPETAAYEYLRRLALHLALLEGRTAEARQLLEQLDPRRDRSDLRVHWARWHIQGGDRATAAALIVAAIRCQAPLVLSRYLRECTDLDAGAVVLLWRETLATAAIMDNPPVQVAPVVPEVDGPLLIGASSALAEVRAQIQAYARLDQPALVVGETGTGKEIVTRLLHAQGPRPRSPFLALNCAALPDSLAEAELFGHARGSFTGAVADHAGLLAAAADGTLLLDEINSMSLRLQALLLRLLETGEYRPIGSTTTLRASCRFVIASNRDLAAAVAEGTFRADLSYRLERLAITLPPLRERREDIPHLVTHFLAQHSGGDLLSVDGDLLAALRQHDWPGNVRQLRNLIERLVALRGGRTRFTLADCPELLRRRSPTTAATSIMAPAAVIAGPAIPGPPRARRRRHAILDLFAGQTNVYNQDVREAVGGTAATVAADLAALVEAGLIRRVITSTNLRTSFYVRA